jgi:hypothetical protein
MAGFVDTDTHIAERGMWNYITECSIALLQRLETDMAKIFHEILDVNS